MRPPGPSPKSAPTTRFFKAGTSAREMIPYQRSAFWASEGEDDARALLSGGAGGGGFVADGSAGLGRDPGLARGLAGAAEDAARPRSGAGSAIPELERGA